MSNVIDSHFRAHMELEALLMQKPPDRTATVVTSLACIPQLLAVELAATTCKGNSKFAYVAPTHDQVVKATAYAPLLFPKVPVGILTPQRATSPTAGLLYATYDRLAELSRDMGLLVIEVGTTLPDDCLELVEDLSPRFTLALVPRELAQTPAGRLFPPVSYTFPEPNWAAEVPRTTQGGHREKG